MEAIQRVTLVKQVQREIRKLIEEEHIAPGSKLPTEMDLCRMLNVSRGTVREAFQYLQAKGIVELKAGRGAFVAEKKKEPDVQSGQAIDWLVQNEQDLRNAFQLRAAIEPVAAGLTAERIDEEQIERLKKIHQEFSEIVNPEKAERLAELDREFHTCIMENCGNQLMIDVINRLNDGLALFRKNTFTVKQNIKDAVGPHKKILQAIENHDSARAEKEMRRHLELVGANLTVNISMLKEDV